MPADVSSTGQEGTPPSPTGSPCWGIGISQDGRFVTFGNDASTLQVAILYGGDGTTGDEVVGSLPLRAVGLRHGGHISHVRLFTALGTYDTGPARVLDQEVPAP